MSMGAGSSGFAFADGFVEAAAPRADDPVLAARLLPQVVAADGRIVLETPADAPIAVPGLTETYNRRIAAARVIIMGAA